MPVALAPARMVSEMSLLRNWASWGRETRVIAFTLLTLVGTMVLAGGFSWSRRGVPLGGMIHPEGWRIRFRPPARWPALDPKGLGPDMRAYDGGVGRRGKRLFIVRDASPRAQTPERLVELLLMTVDPGISRMFTPRAQVDSEPFGPFPGATIEDHAGGLIVSAAYVEGESYGVALVSGGPLSPRDREVAERVVGSVEYAR